jgi:recombination protein RecA
MAKKTTSKNPITPTDDQEGKRAALESAMKGIIKKYGEGAVMMMDDESIQSIEALSTGSLTLDMALGIGGLPKGRIIEIFGPEGAGKSTLALHCVAEAQKAGGRAAYVDVENAMDAQYAKAIGVKLGETLIAQPESGEQALDIAEQVIRSNAVDIMVIDSVAALVPQAEIDGEMSDQQVGAQARMMSKAMRKLTAAINQTKTVCIFINQLREKVGVMYGNPEVQPGGRALKFYASVRLDIRKQDVIKEGGAIVGNKVRVKVVKNKVAPPFKEAHFDIMFGKGVDYLGEILDIGVTYEIVKKSGSYYSYDDERLGQGRDNAKQFLHEHPEMMEKLNQQVREAIFQHNKSTTPMAMSIDEDDEPDDIDEDDI